MPLLILFLIILDFSVSIIATPDKLRSNGEWATVSWNGVSNPNKDDWIGVYPLRSDKAVVNPKEQAPLKYQVCTYPAGLGYKEGLYVRGFH